MKIIRHYFTELAEHFSRVGRRVQIRVYPQRHIALKGRPYVIEMVKDKEKSAVDIRIGLDHVREYSYQVLDVDREGKKLLLGARKSGRIVKTWFFDRNADSAPVSRPGLVSIVDYEKALDHNISINYRVPDSAAPGFGGNNAFTHENSQSISEKITRAFGEIGLHCISGFRFASGRNDRISVDFSRISAILDIDRSKRQILLKGSGEVNWLCGMDERHAFVALVPREANSVRRAHKLLLPEKLQLNDAYKRQGEWFFVRDRVPVNPGKKKVISGYELKRNPRSKPHVAEFAIKKGNRVYAGGWVEHEDHKALFLDDWHRVELNNEIVDKYTHNPD